MGEITIEYKGEKYILSKAEVDEFGIKELIFKSISDLNKWFEIVKNS